MQNAFINTRLSTGQNVEADFNVLVTGNNGEDIFLWHKISLYGNVFVKDDDLRAVVVDSAVGNSPISLSFRFARL